jgi:hypothetical protein
LKRLTPEEISELLMFLPDEDMGKVLKRSYTARDEQKFIAIFNHIGQHRTSAVWMSLAEDEDVMHAAIGRFGYPEIFDSLNRMLPVILPIFLSQEIYNDWYVVLYLFRAFLAQPKKQELFQKYGDFISRELISQGRDPKELFKAAIAYIDDENDRKEIWRLLPKRNWWDVLKKSVIGFSAKFLWDTICRTTPSQQDVEKLREWAAAHGIPNAEKMNGRQLCVTLASVHLPADDCDPEDIDPWSQESMYEIPPHRRYKIGDHCFDIQSLHEAVQKGERRNPFDRSPLDVSAIQNRYALIRNTYKMNPLHGLRDIPIMNKQQFLTQTLANIWSVFKYPVPIEAFLRASEPELDNVLHALASYSVIPLTTNEVQRYKSAKERDAKFDILVQIMQRIISLPENEYTTTIHTAMELALNENIHVRKRTRSEDDSESPTHRPRIGGRKRRYAYYDY